MKNGLRAHLGHQIVVQTMYMNGDLDRHLRFFYPNQIDVLAALYRIWAGPFKTNEIASIHANIGGR